MERTGNEHSTRPRIVDSDPSRAWRYHSLQNTFFMKSNKTNRTHRKRNQWGARQIGGQKGGGGLEVLKKRLPWWRHTQLYVSIIVKLQLLVWDSQVFDKAQIIRKMNVFTSSSCYVKKVAFSNRKTNIARIERQKTQGSKWSQQASQKTTNNAHVNAW